MKSEQRAKQLREALAKAKRTSPGQPYPDKLRGAAHEYRKERELEGVSLRQVAAELGIEKNTLLRWSRAPWPPGEVFHAIEVVQEPEGEAGKMVVHGPRGLRIEGLTVEQLAALIERLS